VDEFRRSVFYEGVWRALLASLVAGILTICFSASARASLLIGANVALIFAFLMMLYASRLTQGRYAQVGNARVRNPLDTAPLRFAQGGAGVAIALSSSALVI
jgi:hypothetical protein